MSVCLSDSFVLINQEGNSMRHTPWMEYQFIMGLPSIFSPLFLSLTYVIYVSFDSLTIRNPKMRIVTTIDFSLHLA